ncbi:MAG: B12-binding domain-containing radical SAM protein [Clostridia bacterium]|nr:B12-binding domain-containing radical SAM protein [Clostridia bacterium]
MPYEGLIYRPPSEAHSLILQVTVGCSHGKCTFCSAYLGKRFRIKDWAEIEEDINLAQQYYGPYVERIFLADGNALVMDTERLLSLLARLYEAFPRLKRVGIYGGPRDILRKTPEELRALREAGLGIVYLGVESGDDEILRAIRKGANAEQMIRAGRAVIEAGLTLSVTVIAGLGGPALSERHARRTAAVINAIDPPYLGVLTLMVEEGTPLAEELRQGRFTLLTPWEVLQELRWLVEGLETTHCVFRANHASNYLPLGGVLAREKGKVLAAIDRVLAAKDSRSLRPEALRAL